MGKDILRVFVSSTSKDLEHHRCAIRDAILKQEWLPVMMENFGTSPEHTVEACRSKVRGCDLVLLLVAFRQGWVPTKEQGGDGRCSVTAFELEERARQGIPVRILLARENWPGKWWENNQKARKWVQTFRDQLDQIGEQFEAEFPGGSREPMPGDHFRVLVRQALQDHREWLLHPPSLEIATGLERKGVGAETVLATLEPLLTGISVTRRQVAQLYQRRAPLFWDSQLPQAIHPGTFLIQCIRNLAQAPRQGADGTFPLLALVEDLLDLIPEERMAPMRHWLEQATDKLIGKKQGMVPQSTVAQSDQEPPPASAFHLLVKMDRLKTDNYEVKAWLFGGRQPEPLLDGEVQPHAALPGLLNDLLKKLADPTRREEVPFDRLWVEFLLPDELLCADVDRWMVEVVDLIPIGYEHRVVVRSLDRMKHARFRQALKARWETAVRVAEEPCRVVDMPPTQEIPTCPALRLDGTSSGGKALYLRLGLKPCVVCAVLEPPPTDVAPNGVLQALLRAGIPFILWTRQRISRPDKSGSSDLVHEKLLMALPDRVWDFRREAEAQEDPAHPGRHLTLLWDNPMRVSPDLEQFKTPQQES